jgi:LmbE family N-acetylglucosaminyl deacetylase
MSARVSARRAARSSWNRGALTPVLSGLLAAGLLAAALPARAQEPGRTPAIVQQLRTFANTGTVLHVAAHPDDENTQLITAMARGRGYRTAYLSVTRGDGGQNELGKDFDEKLGVLRTQELIAARKLDGGRQFFTRAIDYGYSKSPEEALRIWDHQAVLGDVVRVIRTFRPDVIITRFPIPPGSGGHGQHTASAMLAVEAFKLAADPTAFPDQIKEGLAPWQAKRIGWNGWGNNPSPLHGPIIQFDIGGADPVTSEPFATIANQSRGMHKTQTLGFFAARTGSAGPNMQTFQLLAGDAPVADIMDGVDTTWARIPGGAALIPLIEDAIAKFNPAAPAASVPALLGVRSEMLKLGAKPRSSKLYFTAGPGPSPRPHDFGLMLDEKLAALEDIICAAVGLKAAVTTAKAEALPGEQLRLTMSVSVDSAAVPVDLLAYNNSLALVGFDTPRRLEAGVPLEIEEVVGIPRDTPLTHPYWLREESSVGLHHVADATLIGTPETPPALTTRFEFNIGGQQIDLVDIPVEATSGRNGDRQPVHIIPPLSLVFAHEMELFAPRATKQVAVTVTASRAGSQGDLSLSVPPGWTVRPASQHFALAQPGDHTVLRFSVTAPANPVSGQLAATALVDGIACSSGRIVLDYPHLPLQLLQPPARSTLTVLDAQTRGKRIGYLPGAGDSTVESLTQLGYEVVTLTDADLAPEKLAGLDAVVLGVRAFNDRADLAANLPGLYAWVEAGGTVVTQYNRPNGLKATALGPYELSIEGPAPRLRVTDENAPVTFLAPDHPVLNVPNKITEADFEGWVQERGAYFPSKWDEARYTAILAMNDPGEAPLRSSLLVAQHGRGWFVYTGLSFFRQLPAGHPGAHRLFANLVSLGK